MSCSREGRSCIAVRSAQGPRKAFRHTAKVVELKFFGGLEVEEIAELLGLSSATVKRDWALARAWLYRALNGS
jgi:DNA-directed RNA polymerase specialized sigma24 family protein